MPAEGWMPETIERSFAPLLARIRTDRPLVHNVTNFVVMNFTANVLLAVGASPVMAHAPEEVSDFVAMSRAVVINMGTVDSGYFGSMELATRKAKKKNVPWVLDPVGIGATRFREGIGRYLARQRPSVIRGNASEIIALAGGLGRSKGVDSLDGSEAAVEAGKRLSLKRKTVVAVTGSTDFIIDGDNVTAVHGGHPMSQQVTGTGCAVTAVVGAFLAVAPPREAAIAALELMKHAAEIAGKTATGPGSFSVAFIDALAAA
jgi:hydroxyethylthiazole kinase